MWYFYPIEVLPQATNLLVSERTKLEYYMAQLWYLTEGAELIWQTQDENGIQVPHGTISRDNRMIQPCDYVIRLHSGLVPLQSRSKAMKCLTAFVATLFVRTL